MAKMTAPIQEVSRLLDLVPYLSTKELADEFGVSEREISNELTALSMCGLPGYTDYELIDVSFDSGFVTIRNHDPLDIPRALTSLEVATLLIGLEIMRDGIDSDKGDLVEKIDSLISQLSPLVGSSLAVESHPQALHSAQIQKAIAERKALEISYESSLTGASESRLIEPLSLYLENSHTYLSAYCHKAQGYRNFRVDRITEISLSSAEVQDRDPISGSTDQEEFIVRVSGRRRAIAEFLQVDRIDDDGEIEISAYSRDWVSKTVTSFAPDAALIKPEEFQAAIAGRLENILALYRS
jgi:proteasome accessory factor C